MFEIFRIVFVYHKVGSDRELLTVSELREAVVGGRVVVTGFGGDSPSHVHGLQEENSVLTTDRFSPWH